MKTRTITARNSERKVLGSVKVLVLESFADIEASMKSMGLDEKEMLIVLNKGIQFFVGCRIRQKAKDSQYRTD